MRSPGHRHVLVSERYDELGVGLDGGTPERHRSGVTAAAVLGDRDCSP